MASGHVIAKARDMLAAGVNPDTAEIDEDVATAHAHPCPRCGGRMLIVEFVWARRPTPASVDQPKDQDGHLMSDAPASLPHLSSGSCRYSIAGYAIPRSGLLHMPQLARPSRVVEHCPRPRNELSHPLDKRDRCTTGSQVATDPARCYPQFPIALAARPSTTSRGFFP